MFIQLHEREEQNRRLRRARALLDARGHTEPVPRLSSPATSPAPEPLPRTERGVFEDLDAPAGTRMFRLVSSTPGKVGIVMFPAEWVTLNFIENLWRRLDANDKPQGRLKAI